MRALPAPLAPRHHVPVDDSDQPVTDQEAEVAFLSLLQVMELSFGLIRAEWECAMEHLRAGRLVPAVSALRRSILHFEALNASWASLRCLTSMEFNRFRDHLGVASGFQSWAYRHLEFLVGLKARPLTRAGLPIDAARLELDFSVSVGPDASVEQAWVEVYRTRRICDPLRALADALSDLAEAFQDRSRLHAEPRCGDPWAPRPAAEGPRAWTGWPGAWPGRSARTCGPRGPWSRRGLVIEPCLATPPPSSRLPP